MMSYKSRTRFFHVLFLVFLVALPIFIFYTTGYRISFEEEGTTVVTTGGIYVTTDNLEVDVFLDDEYIERPRLFRSAYYIQNIETGEHRVVVQKPELHTWVKVLHIEPYLVAEAAAFNMPVVPQIRPIAEFVNSNGQSVYFGRSTSTELFPKASTTDEYVIETRTSTIDLTRNQEFDFVDDLFTSTTSSQSLLDRIETQIERFQIATTTPAGEATTSLQYIERSNMRLMEQNNALYAVWAGNPDSVPHYFCVADIASSTIAVRYGEHVALQVEGQRQSTTTPLWQNGNRLCRSEIKLDNKWMDILSYNFLPGTSDLVVLQLEDGLYVGEIDDRAWQNTQLIYPGDDFEVIVTDDSIYINEDGRYFELLTEIEEV